MQLDKPAYNNLIRILSIYSDYVSSREQSSLKSSNYDYLNNFEKSIDCLTNEHCNYHAHLANINKNNTNKTTEIVDQQKDEGFLCHWFKYGCINKNKKQSNIKQGKEDKSQSNSAVNPSQETKRNGIKIRKLLFESDAQEEHNK